MFLSLVEPIKDDRKTLELVRSTQRILMFSTNLRSVYIENTGIPIVQVIVKESTNDNGGFYSE